MNPTSKIRDERIMSSLSLALDSGSNVVVISLLSPSV